MLNSTSLKSGKVRLKVLRAMKLAMKQGYAAHVKNRKGENYIRIKRLKTNVGRMFQFVDKNNRDVTELFYNSMRS